MRCNTLMFNKFNEERLIKTTFLDFKLNILNNLLYILVLYSQYQWLI